MDSQTPGGVTPRMVEDTEVSSLTGQLFKRCILKGKREAELDRETKQEGVTQQEGVTHVDRTFPTRQQTANTNDLSKTLSKTHLVPNGTQEKTVTHRQNPNTPNPNETVASSSYTAPPSYTDSSSQTIPITAYIEHYSRTLSADFTPYALAYSPLPHSMPALEELSRRMADEAYLRYQWGFLMLLSPKAHPHYPYWLPEHEGNYAVEAALVWGSMLERERERGK
ncbi:hypothetical protein E8E13_005885 [Curvularia kusanoi]|uniref:Uncharacterized protein n=1 Tax=Curvularia kusanoi TaxID=90978 RepID=A0A9P4T9P6_CURKU|nr:hypothetical protein E8E13_005885 [Curvularia kusanoi]